MKVGGPKPPIPSPPLDSVGKAEGARDDNVAEAFRQVLSGEPEAAAPAAARDPALEALAAKLRSGDIGADEAGRQIVEIIVKRRGANLAPRALDQLRAVLEQALEQDPHLAAKVAQMARTKPGDDEA